MAAIDEWLPHDAAAPGYATGLSSCRHRRDQAGVAGEALSRSAVVGALAACGRADPPGDVGEIGAAVPSAGAPRRHGSLGPVRPRHSQPASTCSSGTTRSRSRISKTRGPSRRQRSGSVPGRSLRPVGVDSCGLRERRVRARHPESCHPARTSATLACSSRRPRFCSPRAARNRPAEAGKPGNRCKRPLSSAGRALPW